MNRLKDITKQFLFKSKPNVGKVIIENGLDKGNHINEILTAYWLLYTFGGLIVVLKERNMYMVSTPDYEWNGKYWELKSSRKKNSFMKAIRKGLIQTKDNRGGLILDIDISMHSYNSIIGFINKELNVLHKASGYIIIKSNNQLLSVLEIIKGASSR